MIMMARITSARRALFGMAGPAKRTALTELTQAETALARRLYTRTVASLDAAIHRMLQSAKDQDLFGRRRGLSSNERATLKRLRAARNDLRAALRTLNRESRVPFFSFESHFGDVLAPPHGGFDVVVGNPPRERG